LVDTDAHSPAETDAEGKGFLCDRSELAVAEVA